MLSEIDLERIRRDLSLDTSTHPTGTLSELVRKNYRAEGYHPDELTVLKHFFTNTDKNVFGVIPGRMPDELWALLIGSYSRSEVSLRDNFLGIIKKLEQKTVQKSRQNPEQTGSATQIKTGIEKRFDLKTLADNIRSSGEIEISLLLENARLFLEKWAVDYGHNSLKDSDILRLSVEGVSQLATKYLETAVLGAYQEKSTRYLSFNSESLVFPPMLRYFYGDRIDSFGRNVMQRYAQAETDVKAFLASKVLNRDNFKSESAFNRTLNAKTFDIIRYFLPLAVKTSLGMTISARELERHLSWLISLPLEEMKLVGYNLLVEGRQLSPALLKHVGVNGYEIKRSETIANLAKELNLFSPQEFTSGRNSDAVILVPTTENPEALITASILQEYSNQRFNQLLETAKDLSSEQRRKIFAGYFGERGPYEALGKAAELGLLVFDLVLDNGAYRDLARHRKGTILKQRFSPEHGFEWPEYIAEEKELSAVRDNYLRSVDESFELWQEVVRDLTPEAQYLSLMGHKVQYVYAADPKQMAYMIELRTGPSGHHSYRTFCQEMFRAMEREMPLFSEFVRVNLDFTSSRKNSEETVTKNGG